MLFAFINRIRLRFQNIKTAGCVVFKKHSSADLSIKGYFVIGARILGEASPASLESRVVLDKYARMEVENVTLGRGTRVKVQAGGRLKIGHNTYLSDNCFISSSTAITIGRDCEISWEVQFLDDDGHKINNQEVKKPIIVGDHVWIGSRATILKGSDIGMGCVVAAGAVVSGKFPPNCLIGGVPARVIRENINWK
jgi:acetyltransferase-like isoleucine patch superfamily enzyme